MRLSTVARIVAAVPAARAVASAARRQAPVRPTITPLASIAVIVPARDEETRILPLLASVVGAPGVTEVVVVDDRSADATAAVAARGGARVLVGTEPPPGWTGKAWAIQQGIEAVDAEWIVALDADTRPDPRLAGALVARAVGDRLDLVSVAGAFECPTPGARWLHPAMLTTLVYRYGAPGRDVPPDGDVMANGQCMAWRRAALLAAGGMAAVAAHPVEDVALARHFARAGWSVAFLDATDLLTVRAYETLRETWLGWGRSLALAGVESRPRQAARLATIVVAQCSPTVRLLARRGDVLDVALSAMRIGTLVGTRPAYRRRGWAFWLSPLADPLAAAALLWGSVTRRQTWKRRRYAVPTTRPARTARR